MTEQCENCRFWKSDGKGFGDCRRNAPRARDSLNSFVADLMGHIAWAQYKAAGINPDEVKSFETEWDGANHASWPETEYVDWCGEYAAKT